MGKINPVLTVVVTYLPGTGRCKTATRISIRVGGQEVAHKTLGLRYSQEDARKEWQRGRRTFTCLDGSEGLLRLAA